LWGGVLVAKQRSGGASPPVASHAGRINRRYATESVLWNRMPWVETHGYRQASLREEDAEPADLRAAVGLGSFGRRGAAFAGSPAFQGRERKRRHNHVPSRSDD